MKRTKEIIAVYQDCVLCGDRGRQKMAEFAKKGFIVRKVGFTTPEGKELCRLAVFDHGIKTMPFFTDGEKFSAQIDDLFEKSVKKPKKSAKKNKKVEKEAKDGSDSES